MKIISRYIVTEIVKVFWLVLLMVIGIYLAVEFLEKIDDFLEVRLPLSRMAAFMIYETPFIIVQILPVAQLLAVLIVLGLMNRHNEIVALRSGGVSMFGLVRPVLALGTVFGLLLFALSEFIVPVTMGTANRIWTEDVRHSGATLSRGKNIWIRADRAISHISYYDPHAETIHGITFYQFGDAFELVRRLDAERGVFNNGNWDLAVVLEQRFDPGGGPRMHYHDTMTAALGIQKDDLTRVARQSQEMGVLELGDYIDTVSREGYDTTAYRVDYHAKFAFPMVCLIMSLVGVAIAIRSGMKDGLAMSVVYGIGVAFCYWVFNSFCLSLGYGGVLPVWLAAWAANLVFFSVSGVMLLYAE